jgi:integrase
MLSSITETTANRFLKTAEIRDVLSCKKMTGLSLIKLDKGGSWRWRYSINGKRRVMTIGSYAAIKPQQAAEKVAHWISNEIDPLAEKKARSMAAIDEEAASKHRKLQNYLDNYYLPYMERSWKLKNAKSNYDRITRRFPDLLSSDMIEVNGADIDRWQIKRENTGAKYSTIRRDYGALKTLLNTAVRDKVILTNPLANHILKLPKLADQKSDDKESRRMLTPKEIRGILSGLDMFAEEIRGQRRNSRAHGKANLPDLDKRNHPHWFIPFCHLALHTGLRSGDLYTLTWNELNINFGRLVKECEKSKHARRHQKKVATVDMQLNPVIKKIMTDWREDNPDSELVFPSPKNGGVMDSQAHRNPWNQVKTFGEVDSKLVFYALRHHFISAMLANGVDVFAVAKLAGHKGVEMILDHYGHLCPNRAGEAIDIVAATIQKQKILQKQNK